MNLNKRYLGANLYDTGINDSSGKRIYRLAAGGENCNVPKDINGNLSAFDNLIIEKDHPTVKYLIKQGPFEIGFHNKNTNKYLMGLKLYTGETMVVKLPGEPAVTPVLKNENKAIEWNYDWGWIRQYSTEKKIKEIIKQKVGKVLTIRYTLNGLTPKNSGSRWDLKRTSNDKIALSLPKPYYIIKVDGEWVFDSYVPYSKQKIDNNTWDLTYPAPTENKIIDPAIVFGEGAGQTGGDHKDCYVFGPIPAFASGDTADLSVDGLTRYTSIGRFSLVNHVQTDADILSSTFSLYDDGTGQAGSNTLTIHKLTHDFGVTKTDEGTQENPATGGQPTYRRSVDKNGAGGDVLWTSGNLSANDHDNSAEDSNVIGAVSNGTKYDWEIPVMTTSWKNDDSSNYGWILVGTAVASGFRKDFHSQESLTIGYRPKLTVDFTVPAGAPFFFFDSTKYKHSPIRK